MYLLIFVLYLRASVTLCYMAIGLKMPIQSNLTKGGIAAAHGRSVVFARLR